jgi:hypothetical protein
VYFPSSSGVPSSLSQMGVDTYLAAGRYVILSLKYLLYFKKRRKKIRKKGQKRKKNKIKKSQ